MAAGAVLTAATLFAVPADAATPGQKPGSIAGTVSNKAGDPISGIEVYAFDAGTTQIVGESESAPDGSYSEPNLQPGNYDIYFFPAAAAGSWLSGWYKHAKTQSKATPVVVVAKKAAEANITLKPAGTVDGTVTGPGGMPVSGIQVYAYPAGSDQPVAETESATGGTYTLSNLASGTYDLSYSPSGSTGSWLSGWYKHATSQATATPLQVTAPDATVAHIHVRVAATITGTVSDAAGDPVPGINVYAYVAGSSQIVWEATSAANGTFTEPNLAEGSYDLYYFALSGAWKTGWYENAKTQATATPIAVVPPATTTVEIVVKPSK